CSLRRPAPRTPPLPCPTPFRSRALVAADLEHTRDARMRHTGAPLGRLEHRARELAISAWETLQQDRRRYVTARQDATRAKAQGTDRKSTRLNSSHVKSSYAVFC